MIWGHCWEFDGDAPDKNWQLAESLCEKPGGRDDIWYVGAAEFVRYVNIAKRLQNNEYLHMDYRSNLSSV